MALDFQTQRVTGSYINSRTNLPSMFGNIGSLKNIAVQVGSGECNWYGYDLYNPNSVDVFLKLYNSTAIPTVGGDTPIETIHVPSLCSVVMKGTDILYHFTLGLWIAYTTSYFIVDNTAPTLGSVAQIVYKE